MSAEQLDLNAIRAKLQDANGPQYWRSLEAVAETPEFKEFLHREFPANASEFNDPVGRRNFLKLMSASLALAGVTGCTVQPDELIVPYVRQPEELIPGKPLFYATAMSLGGVATGLLVESHEGRPTKIEGNPDHPATLGGTDLFAQASVLTLYDPDRSSSISELGEIRGWSGFIAAMRGALSAQAASRGAGLRILTETVNSPTLAAQIQQIIAQYPEAKWVQWEPTTRDNVRAGARLAFGEYLEPVYDFTKADVVLSLDADFLAAENALGVKYARAFASRRRLDADPDRFSRLYVAEATPSVTGGRADHRLPMKSGHIDACARAVAAAVGVTGVTGAAPAGAEAFVAAVAKDLAAHRGTSLVVAGEGQPAAVHALAHAMNDLLGNAGQTVSYLPTAEVVASEQHAAMRELVVDMDAGRVQMLLLVGEANPVFTAPADWKFGDALRKVALRAHTGLFHDETAAQCQWHVPSTHFLEMWSDARSLDGTVSIVQPLLQPMHGGKSPHEVIATLSDRSERNGYDLVREFWSASAPAASTFEKQWRRWLHDGYVAGSASAPKAVALAAGWNASLPAATAAGAFEVVFKRDASIYDGRFANNGWLQELPKPVTKLTWDNAALIGPSTAERLGVANNDVLKVTHDGRSIEVPAWIDPGHAPDTVTIAVGYGRASAGRVGTGVGVNTYALRGSSAPWFGSAEVAKTGDTYALVSTQDHWSIDGRNLVRSTNLEDFKANPAFAHEMEHMKLSEGLTLYPKWEYSGYAWGMAIDLNTCTGCNACVVACQSENNIPVVGKDQVANGREMHWIRIDRYYSGDIDNPDTYYQPMPCQQCEDAPCEVVCPVAATVHSAEGLNDMVYNRCVGTRYCSNNCPWKVRRFNFTLYQDWETPSLKMQRNPDVTVRSRGVMEKCTYCVQRINSARIQAKREDREIRDGEVVTACEAACPSQAITFGNLNDPTSRVAKLKASPRNYSMLAELNTKPRTTYLAAVRNPNPALPSNPTVGGHHAVTHEANSTESEH
ncbi:MAG TPA: TAT-variant-translocated molybdopterin oxidoreductase [Vicinamibacterales bacterium]|nr:TAT-variant-translocated molybdopterin oxidoreductase [Vicinamibacterales bacterium]